MNIPSSSAWSAGGIAAFLRDTRIPLRLAVNSGTTPLICSLWYCYNERTKEILCATQRNSRIVKAASESPRCGFEVGSNEPPYKGVRGQAQLSWTAERAPEVLEELITRYLGSSNTSLRDWLLSRSDSEVILCLKPDWISAWDYSDRMTRD